MSSKPGNTFANQMRAMEAGDVICVPIVGASENNIRMRAQRLNAMGDGFWSVQKREHYMEIRRVR